MYAVYASFLDSPSHTRMFHGDPDAKFLIHDHAVEFVEKKYLGAAKIVAENPLTLEEFCGKIKLLLPTGCAETPEAVLQTLKYALHDRARDEVNQAFKKNLVETKVLRALAELALNDLEQGDTQSALIALKEVLRSE